MWQSFPPDFPGPTNRSGLMSDAVQLLILGIALYGSILSAILFLAQDIRDPRKRARCLLSAPIWPLALLVWGLQGLPAGGRAIGRLFRAAFQPTVREQIIYKG